MIRFDQREIDVTGTEQVYKKVVHSGQNAIRLTDKDGIPMRLPNTAILSRLHSTYVLSPRGVPTRKSFHSYSGQLTSAKMQSLVGSLETSSQELASYGSIHSYHGNGLSSAGSSRHYLSTAGSQRKPPRHLVAGPPRSIKSMNKSATSQRSSRPRMSAPTTDQLTTADLERSNESPQGRRLEKEWSAVSQCRALKRSSEIVSHRVDRMYFMTGNKLKLEAKYHVEENELQQLRDLQQARTSARSSRSNRSRKGDVYRPVDLLSHRSTDCTINGDMDGTVVVSEKGRRKSRQSSGDSIVKETKEPHVIVSQKVLQPRKSPLLGWAGEDNSRHADENIDQENSLHGENGQQKTEAIENKTNGQTENENENGEIEQTKETTEKSKDSEQDNEAKDNKNDNEDKENINTEGAVNGVNETKGENSENVVETNGHVETTDTVVENGDGDLNSVQRDEVNSVISDKDKIDIKTEDYLQ